MFPKFHKRGKLLTPSRAMSTGDVIKKCAKPYSLQLARGGGGGLLFTGPFEGGLNIEGGYFFIVKIICSMLSKLTI